MDAGEDGQVRRGAAQRFVIVGATGSGKSTLAASLAARLNLAHVELDALHWEANWTMAELATFRGRAECNVAQDRWVIDGNYPKVRDLVWDRAEVLVWLDFPFPLTFGRLLCRTIWRIGARLELWNGNRENFATQFLSRNSILLWAAQSRSLFRATYPTLIASQRFTHLAVVRLRSPRETAAWLVGLSTETEQL